MGIAAHPNPITVGLCILGSALLVLGIYLSMHGRD